jgi:DNA-binding NarL/FixJ family response regulator
MIRSLLVDDHASVRRSLSLILAAEPDCEVCAEASTGEEPVASAMPHRPDVAIVDLVMPGLNGIEITRRILLVFPTCAIAIVKMHANDDVIRAAITARSSNTSCRQCERSPNVGHISRLM